MVSTSVAGTNEIMTDALSLADTSRVISALADKIAVLDEENAAKMVKGEMNSLKKRLNEAEELNESLRKEKNDKIDKLKESFGSFLKEKAEEIGRLKFALEKERKAKIPPKFPAMVIDKLCKKDSVNSLRKTIVVTTPSPTPVGKTVIVKIDVKEAGYEALDIIVNDPGKDEVATTVTEVDSGILQLEFKARIPGDYVVHVRYAGDNVPGGYKSCGVYDASKITFNGMSYNASDKTISFYANIWSAGAGELKAAVNDEIISAYMSDTWHKYYKFTRDETKDYIITSRFNDETVPGTPIHVKAGEFPK